MLPHTLRLACLLASLLAPLAVATAQPLSPAEYLNVLNADYTPIIGESWDYVRASSHSRNARRIEAQRVQLLGTLHEAIARVGQLPAYEGDAAMRDAVVTYLQLHYHILAHDYAKIVDLEALAEQSFDAMQAYMQAHQQAEAKLTRAFSQLDSTQQAFASRYGVVFADNGDTDAERKLWQAHAALAYHNHLFLLYIEAAFQERYVLDALGRGDVGALEQAHSSLLEIADRNLTALDSTDWHQDDGSLKEVTAEALVFYQQEALTASEVFVSYFLAKEEYERLNALEAELTPRQRTQAFTRQLNEAINTYNRNRQRFVDEVQHLNRQREHMMRQWNATAAAFVQQHVPR